MWPNPQETANLFTFNEEILNGKLIFLRKVTAPCAIYQPVKAHVIIAVTCSINERPLLQNVRFKTPPLLIAHFTHYSCLVFILFNTGSCKSAFSTDFFGKLAFLSFCAFRVFCLFCVELDVIFTNFILHNLYWYRCQIIVFLSSLMRNSLFTSWRFEHEKHASRELLGF